MAINLKETHVSFLWMQMFSDVWNVSHSQTPCNINVIVAESGIPSRRQPASDGQKDAWKEWRCCSVSVRKRSKARYSGFLLLSLTCCSLTHFSFLSTSNWIDSSLLFRPIWFLNCVLFFLAYYLWFSCFFLSFSKFYQIFETGKRKSLRFNVCLFRFNFDIFISALIWIRNVNFLLS